MLVLFILAIVVIATLAALAGAGALKVKTTQDVVLPVGCANDYHPHCECEFCLAFDKAVQHVDRMSGDAMVDALIDVDDQPEPDESGLDAQVLRFGPDGTLMDAEAYYRAVYGEPCHSTCQCESCGPVLDEDAAQWDAAYPLRSTRSVTCGDPACETQAGGCDCIPF
jgi:hypothetical protein